MNFTSHSHSRARYGTALAALMILVMAAVLTWMVTNPAAGADEPPATPASGQENGADPEEGCPEPSESGEDGESGQEGDPGEHTSCPEGGEPEGGEQESEEPERDPLTPRYHMIYGTVKADGRLLGGSDSIVATVEGETGRSEASTRPSPLGEYWITIIEPKNGNYRGKTVEFSVNGHQAPQKVIWQPGGRTNLDILSFTSGDLPPQILHGKVSIEDEAVEDDVRVWVKMGGKHHPSVKAEGGQYWLEVYPRRNAENEKMEFYVHGARAYPVDFPAALLPLKFSHGNITEVDLNVPEEASIELHEGRPPHFFAGNAYVGKEPAADETVTATVNGKTVATARTDTEGRYQIFVPYQGKETSGAPVFFTVAGKRANRSRGWEYGGSTLLVLDTKPLSVRAAFQDLIFTGTLTTVYRPNPEGGDWDVYNPGQEWKDYNTLHTVLPGDTLWVLVKRTTWFEGQGQILNQGRNVIVLR